MVYCINKNPTEKPKRCICGVLVLPAHCRYERCLLAIEAYNGIEIKKYSLITQIKKLSFIDTLLTIHINCDTILQK